MESFCSFCDEYFDCNTLQLKGIECCYPYHLISYCIYKKGTKIIYKRINKDRVSHLQQTKYMIPMSPVDHLISKNILKMEKNPTKNKYFTRLQEKIIKTENNFHENYVTNVRRKPKINWNDCFPERRRSRRLSNLPPIDEIKVEIKNEDMSESFDNISCSILTKNKTILSNTNFNYTKSEDYVDNNIKPEPTDNIDKFQDEDVGIYEDILDESNLKSIEIKSKDNQNSSNTCQNIDNIPETQFNAEATSFKSTINYDNINLNPDKKHEDPKILSSWSSNTFDKDTYFEKTKTQEIPKSYSINTEAEEISSVPKIYSEKIKINQISSLQVKNSEAIEVENIPYFSEKNSRFTEKEQILVLPEKKSVCTDAKQCPSLPETNSEIIDTENMSSLPETTKPENIIFLSEKNPISTDTNKIQTVSETYSKLIDKEKIPSLSEKNSGNTETKEKKSLLEIYSGIIDVKNMPSPPETIEISDTEEVPTISKIYSGIIKTNENQFLHKQKSEIIDIENMPSPPGAIEISDTEEVPTGSIIFSGIIKTNKNPDNKSGIIDIENMPTPPGVVEISDTEEVPTVSIIYSGIIKTNKNPDNKSEVIDLENMPSPPEAIEISDIEEVPTVSKIYSGIIKTKKNLDNKSEIIDIENMPSPLGAIEISDTEEIPLSAYSAIPVAKKKTFQQDTYSKISQMQEPSPKITVMDRQHNSTVMNGIVVRQIQPFMAVKNRPVLPKIESMNIDKKQKEYFNMTLNEKMLYRRKLNFMTAVGLVTKEKFEEMIKKKNPIVEHAISKKDSSYSKVRSKVNEDYTERVYYRTSSDKVRRSYFLEYSNNNDNEGHIAVPILIPEKTSGTSFHPLRTCMHKCGSCHGKFGSLDTPYHLAQIKNIDKQKACLENAAPLIGPDSCLCATCFRTIEKRSCKTYLPKDSCIIKRCNRTALHIFESSFIDKIKSLFNKKGITFRTWKNKIESMPFCDLHYNKVLHILDCHLCGNRTEEKFDIKEIEFETFQSSLEDDELPAILNHELLICKACRIYLLWRGRKMSPIIKKDFAKLRTTVIKRICNYKNIVLPSFVPDLNSETVELQINTEVEKKKRPVTSTSKTIENYDNRFVMVSSLRTIDNDKVFSGNYYARKCSQSLQTEINAITKSAAITENQQLNQQLVDLAVMKNNISDNQIVPPHVLKRFSHPPVITKSIVGKQTVFMPVLKSKKLQASAKRHVINCKPSKSVQPIQTRSAQTVLNTIDTLPPPPIAIPFLWPQKDLPFSNEILKARVKGNIFKYFKSVQRHYNTSIRLIQHFLVVEKCRWLHDLVFSDDFKRNKTKILIAKRRKEKAQEGFRRGFSQSKLQSKSLTEGNIVKAVMKPLCDGIATIKNKDDNDCINKIAKVPKVNGLCKVVNNIENVIIRHDFHSGKNMTLSPNTTNPIKRPNSVFYSKVICNLPPKVYNNKSSNGDSILSSNRVILPTYAATTVTGTTTTIPVKPASTTITIPSINKVCSNMPTSTTITIPSINKVCSNMPTSTTITIPSINKVCSNMPTSTTITIPSINKVCSNMPTSTTITIPSINKVCSNMPTSTTITIPSINKVCSNMPTSTTITIPSINKVRSNMPTSTTITIPSINKVDSNMPTSTTITIPSINKVRSNMPTSTTITIPSINKVDSNMPNITIPSINKVCSNTNKRFIFLKKNNKNEVNGSRNLTTASSNLKNTSTIKPLSLSANRKNFTTNFNHPNVIKIQPLTTNDKTKTMVCARYFNKKGGHQT